MLSRFSNSLHVKWFTEHTTEVPGTVGEVAANPSFLFWLLVTLTGLLVCALFNDRLQQLGPVIQVHRLFDRMKPYLTNILRVGLGLALLFQLMTGTYIAPELHTGEMWINILLGVALVCLCLRRTLWISAAALTILYVQALVHFGFFHALDYMFYVGVIYYLFVAETKWRTTATPVLYLLTGFSLAWVSFEKFTMPELAYRIIEQNHIPTFGFSLEDFVLISAFIEIGLAWSLIVGILNRFVSLIVTVVFMTTTSVFGFTEVVGHTLLHTLLILFIIEGEGTFTTPFHFHHSRLFRCLFVLVNFCVLLFGFMWIYCLMGS